MLGSVPSWRPGGVLTRVLVCESLKDMYGHGDARVRVHCGCLGGAVRAPVVRMYGNGSRMLIVDTPMLFSSRGLT
jgi:hypothetical protein